MACPTSINQTRIVEIREIRVETHTIKTFIFNDPLCALAKPGQFVMVWVFDVDEIPMSLSMISKENSGITVAKVGEATGALHKKRVGDALGIRGPYGNGFTLTEGRIMLVGGGIGLAPLVPLAEVLARNRSRITFLIGGRTGKDLPFPDRIRSVLGVRKHRIVVMTNDGSYGIKGLVTDHVRVLLSEEDFDMIYTCGPELMMWRVFQIAEAHSTPIQACLERIVKCSLGVCGQCVVDPMGLRVCRDGPVFMSDVLRQLTDFGRYQRDATGRKVRI